MAAERRSERLTEDYFEQVLALYDDEGPIRRVETGYVLDESNLK